MVKKSHNPLKRPKNKRQKTSNAIKQTKIKRIELTPDSGTMWDKHLTKDQNYARLGLHSKQNSNEKVFEKHLSTVPESKYAELPEPGIPAPPKNKVEFPPGEIIVLEEFIKKYASDYKKMAMDYKLNTYQMTPKKIEKRIVKYRQYLKEQE